MPSHWPTPWLLFVLLVSSAAFCQFRHPRNLSVPADSVQFCSSVSSITFSGLPSHTVARSLQLRSVGSDWQPGPFPDVVIMRGITRVSLAASVPESYPPSFNGRFCGCVLGMSCPRFKWSIISAARLLHNHQHQQKTQHCDAAGHLGRFLVSWLGGGV